MNTINQLARQYRKTNDQLSRMDKKLHAAKKHMRDLGEARRRISQDLEQIKLLLDYCVITGEPPLQARLSHTHEQMHASIQDHRTRTGTDVYYHTSLT